MKARNLDTQSPYGNYKAGLLTTNLVKLIRKLSTGWLGKRFMFALRRLARKGIGDICDTELFGARLRMYAEGNISEKRALYAPQFFDLEERQALMALAEDNAVFIDIGANIGLYSFSTASAFKNFKNTRILAVEPHPIISRRLAYNLSLNACLPIEPIVAGLSDRDGVMTMITPEHNLGESRLLKDGEYAPGETTDIPVKTLLNLLSEQSVSRIDGMKIDIEGYEEEVLIPFFDQAPDGLLPRLIIIENNHKKWKKDLVGLAKSRGYGVRSTTRMNVMLEKIHQGDV